MERTHALLSPSAATRWLNCTPSAVAESKVPDKSSDFADEGTVAHALAAKKLRNGLGWASPDEDAELSSERGRKWLNGEMTEAAEFYAQFVMDKYRAALRDDPNAQLFIEQHVEIPLLGASVFGTADALIISKKHLDVIDFKYGQGVKVEASDNPQLMLYAAGALCADECRGVKDVSLVIVQPRKESISYTKPLSSDFLRAWLIDSVQSRALVAAQGGGFRNPGTWCRFCKVKATCKVLAAFAIGSESEYAADDLDADRLGAAMKRVGLVEQWTNAIKDKTKEMLMGGKAVPGFKLVAGRSARKIADPAGLAKALSRAGFNDVYRPMELLTITQLEAMVGRKKFADIAACYICKSEGAPAVAPIDDLRPEYRGGSDFDNM